jgi:signal transduction histidine kinase
VPVEREGYEASGTLIGRGVSRATPAWIALALVVTGLVPLLLVTVIGYRTSSQSLRKDTHARLQTAARGTSAQLDELLFERYGDVQAFARGKRAQSLRPAQLTQLMHTLLVSYKPLYALTLAADRNGRVLASESLPRPAAAHALAGKSIRGSAEFEQALRRGVGVTTHRPGNALGRAVGGRYQVAFAAPIRRNGRVAGVWINVLSWKAVEKMLRSVAASTSAQTLHLFLVDRQGEVLASDLPRGAYATAVAGGATRVRGLEQHRADTLPASAVIPSSGGTDLAAAAGVKRLSGQAGSGWTVVAVQDRAHALAEASSLERRTALIALIAAGLVILLAGVVARLVRRAGARQESLEANLRQAQKLEAVGALAGGVAHDFNNVLTVISGNAQLALIEGVPEASDARLREIVHASERASGLVRQLLSFSRPDTAKARVVDLNDELVGTLPILQRLIPSNVIVTADLAESRLHVLADPVHLEQVLLNLTVNARDAMPEGGTLTFRTLADGERVRLVVEDSGTGIDAATRERIFDPFFTTKPAGKGTGLGLATTHRIVTQAGGGLHVESEPGEGTIFTIDLPRAGGEPAPATTQNHTTAPPARGERVLVADDDELVRAVASEMLSRAGYEVLTAPDGEVALEIAASTAVDLIVCDVMMPRVTGLQLLDRLRAQGNQVPVVLISGYRPDDVGDVPPDGRSATIAKPFGADELAGVVRRLLERAPLVPEQSGTR